MSKKKDLTCTACSGSGTYDNTDSPPCGACHGLGVERKRMPYRFWKHIIINYYGIYKSDIEKIYEKFNKK